MACDTQHVSAIWVHYLYGYNLDSVILNVFYFIRDFPIDCLWLCMTESIVP